LEQPTMPHNASQPTLSQFPMAVTLFGPLRPAPSLQRRTERVIKAHAGGRDHFTDITLYYDGQRRQMSVEYIVTAYSPASAKRVGLVYLSQLCDLLSAVTQCPVRFSEQEDEARDERARQYRDTVRVHRT